MKIRYKVLASLFSILLLLVVVMATTYKASLSVDYYRKRSVLLEEQLMATTNLRAQVRNQLLETYEVGFVETLKEHKIDLTKEREKVQLKFKEFESIMRGDANFGIVQTLRHEYMALDESLNKVIQLAAKGNSGVAKTALLDAREKKFNQGFIKEISKFIEIQKVVTLKSSKDLELSIVHLQQMLITFTVLTLLLAGILLVFVSKSIGDRLLELENATRKISEGDFEVTLSEEGTDEVFILSRAFNTMASSLQEAKNKLIKQQEVITHTSKMSALGEMAGGIAHEINTPLAAIILNAELIEMQNSEFAEPDPTIARHAQSIMNVSQRIAKIINGLKGFSRDATNDDKTIFTANELINTTVDLCREKFKNHGVELQVVEGNLDTLVKGQIVQLSQTLLNLLNNSYDAIQDLKEKWVQINVVIQGQNLELRVVDSGEGISPQVLEKIFNPFFTTKDVGKGTGLGLSISKNIVKQNDGDLFYDETSIHTCFVIRLPIIQKERSAA